MKLIVFAYHTVGVSCLETLLDAGAHIPLVVTHEDDPKEEIWFPSVRRLAMGRGLNVQTPQNPNDPAFVEQIRRLQPDAIFSFYYRHILKEDLLACASRGAFNLHGSLLPKYRGRCPVNWVLIHGEKETGVTLHEMVRKPDAGDIVMQKRVAIEENDTAHTLFGKIAQAGALAVREFYPRLKSGVFQKTPQDPSQATVFGGRRPDDGAFSWDQDARSIYNLVRAVTHPYPGAFTPFRGGNLFVWQAQPCESTAGGTPVAGTIVDIQTGGVVVATGRGCLLLQSVQWAGGEEGAADVFAREMKLRAGDAIN